MSTQASSEPTATSLPSGLNLMVCAYGSERLTPLSFFCLPLSLPPYSLSPSLFLSSTFPSSHLCLSSISLPSPTLIILQPQWQTAFTVSHALTWPPGAFCFCLSSGPEVKGQSKRTGQTRRLSVQRQPAARQMTRRPNGRSMTAVSDELESSVHV